MIQLEYLDCLPNYLSSSVKQNFFVSVIFRRSIRRNVTEKCLSLRLVDCVDSTDSCGQSSFVKRRFVNYTYVYTVCCSEKVIRSEYLDVVPRRNVFFSNEERKVRNLFVSFFTNFLISLGEATQSAAMRLI